MEKVYPNVDQYFVPYNNMSTGQAIEATPIMIQAAEDYAASCPKVPIVFLGYRSVDSMLLLNVRRVLMFMPVLVALLS